VPTLVHPVRESVDQVFDNAEAIVHHRVAHLECSGAQAHEFAASSRHDEMPPIPEIGIFTLVVGGDRRSTRCDAIGLTAGPQ